MTPTITVPLLSVNNTIMNNHHHQQPSNNGSSSDTYQNLLHCLSFLYPQSNPSNNISSPFNYNSYVPSANNNTTTNTSPLLNNLYTSHQFVTSFESNTNSINGNNNFVLPVIPFTPTTTTFTNRQTSAVVIEEEIEEDNGSKSYRKRKTPAMSTLSHVVTTNSFTKAKKHKTRSDSLNASSSPKIEIALDQTEDKQYDPSNSFFLLLKNHLELNERLSKSLMKNKVVVDYTHSTSLCQASSLSQDFGAVTASSKSVDVYKQPVEKLCLLYSMYTHMCQKKGLTKEAKSAYEKTRTLLKQVFDKYDNYYVAFTYCILSLYQSSEGDDESGKFYLDLVDHYFKYHKRNNGKRTDTQNDSNNEEAEINSLIKYVIPSTDMDRDYFLEKFYHAAEVINEAGCQTRMSEIRKLLMCFYSYGTGMKEIIHPEFKGLLPKPIDSTTFQTYLRMVDYTWEMSSLTSKSMNLEDDQRSILKHVGKGYKHTAYSLIITEYLDYLSKHVSPNASSSSINLEILNSDNEQVKNLLPQLYKELDDFMNLCKVEPESLGVMPPAYVSTLSLACTVDLNMADSDPNILLKIERDIDVMYYMSRRYQKVKVVFSDLINKLLEKREELLANKFQ